MIICFSTLKSGDSLYGSFVCTCISVFVSRFASTAFAQAERLSPGGIASPEDFLGATLPQIFSSPLIPTW